MKIAIFGAGQLAMMMIQSDKNHEHEFVVIDPSSKPPASNYAQHIQTDYADPKTLEKIKNDYDIATIDFENVDVGAMMELEKYIPVHPSSYSLEVCQDRLKEKELFRSLNIDTTPFFKVNNMDELEKNIKVDKSYILKTRRFGYDGKNQYRINPNDICNTDLLEQDCILEELVDFESEVSLICVSSTIGDIYYYPLVENSHENGILNMSIYPSNYTYLQPDAELIGRDLIKSMNYFGVLVIEFFVSRDKRLIANEMAPRVHNSGHWTIEGSNISQFESHVNAISGKKVNADSISHKPSAMLNILSKHVSKDTITNIEMNYDVFFHDYHKTERKNRKLGHMTHTCATRDELEENIKEILKLL